MECRALLMEYRALSESFSVQSAVLKISGMSFFGKVSFDRSLLIQHIQIKYTKDPHRIKSVIKKNSELCGGDGSREQSF